LQSWNIELASIAQNYADQCKWAHNSDRSSASSTYSYVGENIYAQTSRLFLVELKEW
jgi:hypothetical protein